MNPYLQEVIDLHEQIEALLRAGEAQVEAMVERFHPDFSMITPSGVEVGLQDVAVLFAQRAGSQPGLSIELTELQALAQWPDGALIRYRETHRLPGQDATTRISTALFSLQGDQVLWLHLHETWAA